MKRFFSIVAALSLVCWACNPTEEQPQQPDEPIVNPDNDGTFSVGNVGLKDGYYNVEFNRGTKMLTVTAAE